MQKHISGDSCQIFDTGIARALKEGWAIVPNTMFVGITPAMRGGSMFMGPGYMSAEAAYYFVVVEIDEQKLAEISETNRKAKIDEKHAYNCRAHQHAKITLKYFPQVLPVESRATFTNVCRRLLAKKVTTLGMLLDKTVPQVRALLTSDDDLALLMQRLDLGGIRLRGDYRP